MNSYDEGCKMTAESRTESFFLFSIVITIGSVGFGWWHQSVGAGLFAAMLLFLLAEITFRVGVIGNALREVNPPN